MESINNCREFLKRIRLSVSDLLYGRETEGQGKDRMLEIFKRNIFLRRYTYTAETLLGCTGALNYSKNPEIRENNNSLLARATGLFDFK